MGKKFQNCMWFNKKKLFTVFYLQITGLSTFKNTINIFRAVMYMSVYISISKISLKPAAFSNRIYEVLH